MADISQYLQAIMAAVYGEDVRGSIHDAIALINDVGETVLTLGTAVDSPTSPTTGFYQESVYLNTATGDMWTCTGTGWSLSGNTKGDKGDPGDAATINVGTVTSGAVASVTNSGTTSAAVFDFVLPQGDKGDTGDGLTAESEHSGSNTIVSIKNATTQTVVDTFNVPDGVPGATGNGIASIAKTATAGLVDTYTITYTDGTSTTFTVTNGQDGQGAGDMTKVAYDPTNAVADAGGIPAYVSAHGGTTYTGEKGVIVAGTTIKAALVNDTASSLASQTISATQNRQYAVNLDNNSKLSVNVPWENTTYNPATTSANGLMSSTDKSKLDGLDAVIANPAGSPTDDLTSIQIGSTVYRLQGGGGTTIVQIPSVSGTSFTYDGTAQGAAITGLDTTHCTVVAGTGTTVTTVGDTTYVKATNAGSYSFSVKLNDTSSMVWSDLTIADKTYSFTIAKAQQTLTASKYSVSLDTQTTSDTVTISGQQTSLNVSSSDTGVATVSESSGVVTITGVTTGSTTVSVYAAETANYAQSNTVSITTQVKLSTVFGFHIDGSESDPSARVSYLQDCDNYGYTPAYMNFTTGQFDYGSWNPNGANADEVSFIFPRPCMLKSDGTVDYYLSENDYTKKADGVTASDVANTSYNGNAMMEWGRNGKKIWYKIVPDNNDTTSYSVYIANEQLDSDYKCYPFINNQGQEVNHFYTAIYSGSVINTKMRSLSGQAVSKSLTVAQEITAARANNGNDRLWDIECWADRMLIILLTWMITKSTNSQNALGKGLCSNGTESINNAFRTGVHNTEGLFYGTNSGTASTYTNAIKLFGMENFYGFQWRRPNGLILSNGAYKLKYTKGTEDGSTATDYNDSGTGYLDAGISSLSGTGGGYCKTARAAGHSILPQVTDGTSTTYYADVLWYNNSMVAFPLVGGPSNDDDRVGISCIALSYVSTFTSWNLGTTLTCKPLV